MKKRLITLAIVALFVLTMVPFVAVADGNLHALPAPTVDDFGDHTHWGWSMENGSLPGNMRGITGIIIEWDIESDELDFIVQVPPGWWDQGTFEIVDYMLEIDFAESFEEWEDWDRLQYEMHLVFGDWQDHIAPENVVNAWLVGDVMPSPMFAPGDVDPVLPPPTVDDFGGHDHWGWSMEIGTLPWNMSEITGILIEFDMTDVRAEFVVQTPHAGHWDHPAGIYVEDYKLDFAFEDFFPDWSIHTQHPEMHLVFGNWGDLTPANVISAQLIGVVAEGIPIPDAVELPDHPDPWEGDEPFRLTGFIDADDAIAHGMGTGEANSPDDWGGMFTWVAGQPNNQKGWRGSGADGVVTTLHNDTIRRAARLVLELGTPPNLDDEQEISLVFQSAATGWGWDTESWPVVLFYSDGKITIPLSAHPDWAAHREGEPGSDIKFIIGYFGDGYGEGGDFLDITAAWLEFGAPVVAAPDPEPPAEPDPEPEEPEDTAPPAPEPEAGGLPVWGWVLIIVGAVVVVVVIIVVVKKKGA